MIRSTKESLVNWYIQRYWESISEKNPYLRRGFDTVREYVSGLDGEPWKGLFLIFGNFREDFLPPDLSGPGYETEKAKRAAIRDYKRRISRGDCRHLRRMNGDWVIEFREIERSRGEPLLYMDSHLGDLYDRMSKPVEGKSPEGAIAFNREGYLRGAQLFVNKPDKDRVPDITEQMIKEIKRVGGDIGTKYIAAADASTRNLPSLIGSEDTGIVVGFWKGFIPDELVYDPR